MAYSFVRALLVALAVSSSSIATRAEDESASQIEEIVVTARRRGELIEDTPVAVTAISGQTMSDAQVFSIGEISALVPNLNFSEGVAGQNVNIQIRGIGTQNTGPAFDPVVALYVDGVYFSRAQGGIFDTLDIQQVEVLRGPQGTLFGKNTVGGAVSVTTKKPDPGLKGAILLRPGNLGAIRARGMLNIPLIDGKLYSRVAFASRNRAGYARNRHLDVDVGDINGLTFLGSLRFLPTDELTIDISGNWWEDQTFSSIGHCVVLNDQAALGNAPTLGPAYYDACRRTGPRDFSQNFHQLNNSSNWGVWGIANWEFGEVGWFEDVRSKTLAAWRGQFNRAQNDLDGTELEGLVVSQLGGPPRNGLAGEADQYQLETQLNAAALDNRLQVVGGAFGFWERGQRGNALDAPIIPSATLNKINIHNWTWALFGQATLDVTDWLQLTAGLRYSQDKKGARQENRNVLDPELPLTRPVGMGREVFDAWTPMASVAVFLPEDWLVDTPVDHWMTYFTYSRGFRGGGFNAVVDPSTEARDLAPFSQETLDNFEVGIKTVLFEDRLSINLAMFEASYNDIQRTVVRSIFDEEGDLEAIQRLTLNAAEATTRGVEVEFLARPLPGLHLSGNLGYLEAKYDSFPDAIDAVTAETIDRTGQNLNNIPEITSRLTAQYAIPLDIEGPAGGVIVPRIEWNYRDRTRFQPPEAAAIQPSYHIFNARLTYRFLDRAAAISFWGQNLSDETFLIGADSSALQTYGVQRRAYGAPRTWGVELTYQFGET